MAAGVRDIVALPDPVGEELEARALYNGLQLRKVRVPLGVVAIVYEARPNVTVDAAALAIKSGNAVVLGVLDGERSKPCWPDLADRSRRPGCPGLGALIGGGDRSDLPSWHARMAVDLVIPRGGEGLKKALKEERDRAGDLRGRRQLPRLRRPAADPEMARRIAYNAKVQRPGVCNAAETLLVHARRRPDVLPG